MGDHRINGLDIRLYHHWYFSELRNRLHLTKVLEVVDKRLNDDCVLMTMRHLNLIDLLHIAKYNHRFYTLAKQRKTVEILPSVIDQPIGLLTLKYALNIFGDVITKLDISIDAIKCDGFGGHSSFLKYAIIHCIHEYTGPQLKIVSLKGFESEDSLSILQNRGIKLVLK